MFRSPSHSPGETERNTRGAKFWKQIPMADDDGAAQGQIQVLENTYIMKPQDHEKFRANEVIKAVKALLDERLKGKKYDSSESAQLSKELCTEIKEKVKEIGAPRHKLVVQVTIGEVQGQGVRIASRCLWDVETDNHASAYYTNPYLYCVAMVFACYYE